MSQEQLKIGQLIDDHQERDAIHVAVIPCIAASLLKPGQHVSVITQDYEFPTAGLAIEAKNQIGIVDPFLRTNVPAGKAFWLFLYPGSITSLRHDWTHPALPSFLMNTDSKSKSEQWIRDFVDRVNSKMNSHFIYEEYMIVADNIVQGINDDICFDNDLEYDEFEDEFWTHYEIVRGVSVPDQKKEPFFRCAC